MAKNEVPPALSPGKPVLDKNPHRVYDPSERNIETAIGRAVRISRRQQGMTISDLARVTGVSMGMLSKIENGNSSPSLATLGALSYA